jgi:hypothetical protein
MYTEISVVNLKSSKPENRSITAGDTVPEGWMPHTQDFPLIRQYVDH